MDIQSGSWHYQVHSQSSYWSPLAGDSSNTRGLRPAKRQLQRRQRLSHTTSLLHQTAMRYFGEMTLLNLHSFSLLPIRGWMRENWFFGGNRFAGRISMTLRS